jgi:hypothetical protein
MPRGEESRAERARSTRGLIGSRDVSFSVFVIGSCGELRRKFASRQRRSAEGAVGALHSDSERISRDAFCCDERWVGLLCGLGCCVGWLAVWLGWVAVWVGLGCCGLGCCVGWVAVWVGLGWVGLLLLCGLGCCVGWVGLLCGLADHGSQLTWHWRSSSSSGGEGPDSAVADQLARARVAELSQQRHRGRVGRGCGVRCVGEGPDPPPSLPPLNEEEDGEEGHDTHPQWTAQQRLEARLEPRSCCRFSSSAPQWLCRLSFLER